MVLFFTIDFQKIENFSSKTNIGTIFPRRKKIYVNNLKNNPSHPRIIFANIQAPKNLPVAQSLLRSTLTNYAVRATYPVPKTKSPSRSVAFARDLRGSPRHARPLHQKIIKITLFTARAKPRLKLGHPPNPTRLHVHTREKTSSSPATRRKELKHIYSAS